MKVTTKFTFSSEVGFIMSSDNRDNRHQRLESISTAWSLIDVAHGMEAVSANAARAELFERYGAAIYRYLLSAVRDGNVAEDLAQEFSLRLVEGRFKNVDPEKGRFRSYVKTVLFHLVHEHRRKIYQKRETPLTEGAAELNEMEENKKFTQYWRDELLARTWTALANVNQVYHDVLRLVSKNPDLDSTNIAEELSNQLGKPMSAATTRQTLHRARSRFAVLLRDEIAASLRVADAEAIDSELADLELLHFYR